MNFDRLPPYLHIGALETLVDGFRLNLCHGLNVHLLCDDINYIPVDHSKLLQLLEFRYLSEIVILLRCAVMRL